MFALLHQIFVIKIFILGNIPCQHLWASLCPVACANLSAAAYLQWPVRPVSCLYWGPSLTYCPGQFFSSMSWEIFSEPCPPPAILLHMQIVFGTGFLQHLCACDTVTLQRENAENLKQIFPEKEYRGLCPNFHIHVSVSELYIPRMGLPVLLEDICRLILWIYKSLKDTWMWKLGLRPRYSQKRNIWTELPLQCILCSCILFYRTSVSNYYTVLQLNTTIKQVECSKSLGLNWINNMG